ncbi:hypothetical protein DUNSADRAFT_8532 [Dunaliella salina]|uniref:Uncharacterized protein n=1 Tax=Dunaliella salina TaxID=3046 RepID=A0ABQ7GJB4_DUNSA|nr:hypothetical protein DUNSADRAFT_8532 [Dunaliella salina]|eukprot:KAF5834707.1 hypothetical protein DUNSADRAFT_8532 [Dunaliella salina]
MLHRLASNQNKGLWMPFVTPRGSLRISPRRRTVAPVQGEGQLDAAASTSPTPTPPKRRGRPPGSKPSRLMPPEHLAGPEEAPPVKKRGRPKKKVSPAGTEDPREAATKGEGDARQGQERPAAYQPGPPQTKLPKEPASSKRRPRSPASPAGRQAASQESTPPEEQPQPLAAAAAHHPVPQRSTPPEEQPQPSTVPAAHPQVPQQTTPRGEQPQPPAALAAHPPPPQQTTPCEEQPQPPAAAAAHHPAPQQSAPHEEQPQLPAAPAAHQAGLPHAPAAPKKQAHAPTLSAKSQSAPPLAATAPQKRSHTPALEATQATPTFTPPASATMPTPAGANIAGVPAAAAAAASKQASVRDKPSSLKGPGGTAQLRKQQPAQQRKVRGSKVQQQAAGAALAQAKPRRRAVRKPQEQHPSPASPDLPAPPPIKQTRRLRPSPAPPAPPPPPPPVRKAAHIVRPASLAWEAADKEVHAPTIRPMIDPARRLLRKAAAYGHVQDATQDLADALHSGPHYNPLGLSCAELDQRLRDAGLLVARPAAEKKGGGHEHGEVGEEGYWMNRRGRVQWIPVRRSKAA